jgi:hypothetical protein
MIILKNNYNQKIFLNIFLFYLKNIFNVSIPFWIIFKSNILLIQIFFLKVKPCNRSNLKNLNILKCDFEG